MAEEAPPQKPKRRKPAQDVRDSPEVQAAMRALGARVRELRLDAELTLEVAAERTGLDWKHLQKVEAGKLNVTLVTVVQIATGYGVTLEDLFRAPKRARRAPRGRAPARSRKR